MHFTYRGFFCLVSSLITIQLSALSQIHFQKVYHSDFAESPVAMTKTADGGYLLLGQRLMQIPDSLPHQPAIRLIRTEADGSKRWVRNFGGTKGDFAHSIVEASNGSIIVGGQTENSEERYPFLLMADSLGQQVWARVYTAIDGNIRELKSSKDGHIYMLGENRKHIFLAKVSLAGALIWHQAYDFNMDVFQPHLAVCQDSSGLVIAATADRNFMLMKLDLEGKANWVKTYGQVEADKCAAVVQSRDGGYLISGTTYNFSGVTVPDMLAIKTDRHGNLSWARAVGTPKKDENLSACQDTDGSFLLAGVSSTPIEGDQLSVVRLAFNGSLMSSRLFGGKKGEKAAVGIFSTGGGGFTLAGATSSFQLKKKAFYLVHYDGKTSGGYEDKVRFQLNQVRPKWGKGKVKMLSKGVLKKYEMAPLQISEVNVSLHEKLLCGNVPPPFDPRMVVKAQARERDSLALVAIYDSTNGEEWRKPWPLKQPLHTWETIELNEDGRIVGINLNSNKLHGRLPKQLGHLSQLRRLHLSSNELIGEVPVCLKKLKHLEQLFLDENQLDGMIPIELTEMASLVQLRLDHNRLVGNIPPEFGAMENLMEFRANNNRLSGTLPVELTELPINVRLDLRYNQLEGGIPKAMFAFKHAQMKGNPFAAFARAVLNGEMGGKYTFNDQDEGATYILQLMDKTERFTLMKGSYDDAGGAYELVKGRYMWDENGVLLQGELIEKGYMEDTASNTSTQTETFVQEIPLDFDDSEGSLQVSLRIFDTDLELQKIR